MLMKTPSILLLLFVAIALVVVTSFVFSQDSSQDKIKAVIYKSQSCGCCSVYSDYLKSKGFQVEVVNTNNMNSIHQKYGVPVSLGSCHTSVIEGYFVEGHVPVEVISKLLRDKPVIKGIALPDMPPGSPGMPGAKTGKWTVYSIDKDGTSAIFMDV
jgi:hypothetical protein